MSINKKLSVNFVHYSSKKINNNKLKSKKQKFNQL